jgi:hypothetical protein
VSGAALSFAVPMNKFTAMVGNIDESFLITKSWKAVRKRIANTSSPSSGQGRQ